ncbi:MAG: type II toxin-antitoxin system HicB family antitoxin [Polaribacter sp.]
MKLTAVIEESNDGWFVGQLEELPEVLSQGKTIDELKVNLLDAFNLFLDTNRENTVIENKDKEVIREYIEI